MHSTRIVPESSLCKACFPPRSKDEEPIVAQEGMLRQERQG